MGPTANDGSVFIDDVSLEFKACPALGSCDFEDDDLCGFDQLVTSDFDWVILTGYSGQAQTAWDVPLIDHTLSSPAGSFVYLETANKNEGERSMMESEVVNPNTADQCLHLYLSLNQYNLATLKVYRKNKSTGSMTQVYSSNQFEGDGWRLKQIDLSQVDYAWSFVIEGVVGNNMLNAGKKGQFAIDDISLKSGKCEIVAPTTEFECKTGEVILASLVCDFKPDCSNGADEKDCGTCTFEDGQCGWEDKSTGSYKWLRARNATTSDNIGPSVDHTLNNMNGKPKLN